MAKTDNPNPSVVFFGFIRKAPPLHFYLVQFVAFAYMAYRFSSRDYSIYGLLPESAFTYPFEFRNELFPIPPDYFTSLQFIYLWLPRPNPESLLALQFVVIASCLLGLIGFFPRVCAWIALGVAYHITGIMRAADSPIDGGTIALAALFVVAMAPRETHYGFRNGYSLKKAPAVHYHWPVALLFLIVGAFYTSSGIAKIVDIGPHWPLVLHLEQFAEAKLEQSMFLTSRFVIPDVAHSHLSALLSIVGGVITLIGEIGFISILWYPRGRAFFVFSMIGLHALVYSMTGINFVGSSLILLLCLDYNKLQRRAIVTLDPAQLRSGPRWRTRLQQWDWLNCLEWQGPNQHEAGEAIQVADSDGSIYTGFDAVEQLLQRIPLLLPIGMLLRFPGVLTLGRWVWAKHKAG